MRMAAIVHTLVALGLAPGTSAPASTPMPARPEILKPASGDATSREIDYSVPGTDTAISGDPGSGGWAPLRFWSTYAVTGVTIGEHNNHPCYLGIDGKDPEHGSDTEDTSTAFLCNGGANIRLEAGFPNNPRYFVRGLSVCLSNSGRVKGVAVVAARLPVGSADVEELVDYESDQSANCATWEPWVYCPNNMVATGVQFGEDNENFTGLGLVCRARI